MQTAQHPISKQRMYKANTFSEKEKQQHAQKRNTITESQTNTNTKSTNNMMTIGQEIIHNIILVLNKYCTLMRTDIISQ